MIRRILILNSEVLIALDLAEMLKEEGFEICGPYYGVDTALDAISKSAPDAAILDVGLGNGITSAQVAEALNKISIPYAFVTEPETMEQQLEPKFHNCLILRKPLVYQKIIAVVDKLLNSK